VCIARQDDYALGSVGRLFATGTPLYGPGVFLYEIIFPIERSIFM